MYFLAITFFFLYSEWKRNYCTQIWFFDNLETGGVVDRLILAGLQSFSSPWFS